MGTSSDAITRVTPLAVAKRQLSSSSPSETSIIAVTCGASARPGSRSGIGRRKAALSPPVPSRTASKPIIAAPTGPVRNSVSPGRAPLREGTGVWDAVPIAVSPSVRSPPSPLTVSPPSSGQPKVSKASFSPARKRSSSFPSVWESMTPMGSAPFAARSDRFEATSFQATSAMSCAGSQWTPSTMASWVSTSVSPPTSSTAASSSRPRAPLCVASPRSASMKANSPVSPAHPSRHRRAGH